MCQQRLEKSRIRLVDFNPFGPVTDSLLFDWHELQQTMPDTAPVDYRVLTSSAMGIQRSEMSMYGQPIDFLIEDGLCDSLGAVEKLANTRLVDDKDSDDENNDDN